MTGTVQPSPTQGPVRSLWSIREDSFVETEGDESVLHTRWGDMQITSDDKLVHELLRRMSLGPIALENVLPDAPGPDGDLRRARLMLLLQRIHSVVIRSLALQDADQPLLSAVPIARAASFTPVLLRPDRPLRLSRFASLRTGTEGLVLESSLSLYRVVFHRPEALWVVAALGRATTLAAAAPLVPLPAEVVRDIAAHLASTGMVVLAEPGGPETGGPETDGAEPVFAEDADPGLATWSGEELLQHTRSRLGRHDHEFGATYRHLGVLPPEPALKPVPDGARIPLHRPGPDEPPSADPPLGAVMEARRSVRRHGSRPIPLHSLGAFLHRVARVRELSPADGADPSYYQTSSRPYPSGGAAYELEFYVTVGQCAGLAPGIYYYDPHGHQLVLVEEQPAIVDAMLLDAQVSADMDLRPQVLITLTSRFQRLSWKYSSMWYALTLKHVGAVQQSMYLVATALGLAPCALGSGDIEASAQAFRLDWHRESSVGEFILGSLPDTADGTGQSGRGDAAATTVSDGVFA